MAKDRTQPYWGLTRNFCLANANLGIPTSDNGEDKSFNDFFGLVGRLVEMHAKFDHPSPVTHKMMLESVRFDMKQEDTTGVSQWSFVGRCELGDLIKFSYPYYGSPYSVKSYSYFPFPEDFLGDFEYYCANLENNPLTNNVIYEYVLGERNCIRFTGSPKGLFVESYTPQPWDGYTFASLGLYMALEQAETLLKSPVKFTILEMGEFRKLEKLLEKSHMELDRIKLPQIDEG